MKVSKALIYLPLAVLFIVSSCVPARKYEELKEKQSRIEKERNELRTKNQELEAQVSELTRRVEELEASNKVLLSDSTTQGVNFRRLQTQYEKINNLNDELLKKYALLQKGSQDENAKLLNELDDARMKLQAREDELRELETQLDTKKESLDQLQTELKKREQRVNELESLIAKKDEAVANLKNKIAEALLSFKDKGLTVEQKNGKVYVSLEAQLLFPSGSTVIDAKGKEALVKLAKALEGQTDLEILVEGHTDTDKISSSKIPRNNWELSVLRSTAVVEILTANSNIDPKKLIAAGRSEFVPIDPTNKAKNRRIEIILSPNLDKIFEIINQEANAAGN